MALGTGVLWCVPFLLLVVVAAHALRAPPGPAVLVAYPAFFGAQVLLAKAASALGLLTTPVFRIVYLAVAVLGLAACVHRLGWTSLVRLPGRDPGEGPDTVLIRRVVFGVTAVLFAGLALFTLVTPVHVWDVLAYHMPMVASYVQNGSLEAWATQDLRQIYRVNAGELQLLNVALLARSDAWVALPNLLGLGVFLYAALELARLTFTRRALPYLAVGLVLTAPQILVGAGTAKNDLMFSAVLLGAFYWMIRAGLEAEPDHARIPVPLALGLAAVSGALAAATKVMGLNVLGAAGLLALAFAWRGRLSFTRVLAFGGAALAALLLLVGDVFWNNLFRTAVPVGIAPGEIHFTFGPANLVEALRYYVYDLSFRRLVAPQVFEHDFLHYGYLFPLLLGLGIVGALRQVRERRPPLVALTVAGALLFLSVIAVRLPIRWDQRFMIWMVPVTAVLALSLARRVPVRYLIALAGLAAGLTLVHLSLTLTMEAESLLPRSGRHLLTTGSPARYVDVPNPRYLYRSDGFEVLEQSATRTDSVLYAGTDDSWMYLAWGPRFTRHVEGVRDAEHASEQVASRRFRFIVMELSVVPGIADAVQEQAGRSGYGVLTEAEGRIIFLRDDPYSSRGSDSSFPRPIAFQTRLTGYQMKPPTVTKTAPTTAMAAPMTASAAPGPT